jgi:hypothetical protein
VRAARTALGFGLFVGAVAACGTDEHTDCAGVGLTGPAATSASKAFGLLAAERGFAVDDWEPATTGEGAVEFRFAGSGSAEYSSIRVRETSPGTWEATGACVAGT